jgi:hypothetical protein
MKQINKINIIISKTFNEINKLFINGINKIIYKKLIK